MPSAVRVAGLDLWFDTYLDRPASIPDVGLTSAQVDAADYAFVSHAHYDHMLGGVAAVPPLFPGVDTGEAVASLARDASYARYVEMPYSEPVSILT